MRRRLCTALALLLLGVPLHGQDTLRVWQVMPQGELRPSSTITITFNRPLAGALERLRDPASVVRLDPAVGARMEWRDPATIRIVPTAPLAPGSRLTIAIDTLTAPDGSRLGGAFAHTFTVRAPAVVGSDPQLQAGQRPTLSPTGRIMLRVSGAIDTADMARTARLERSWSTGCSALTQPLAFRVVVRAPRSDDPFYLQYGGVYNRTPADRRFDQVVELTPVQPPPDGCDMDLVVPLVDAGARTEVRYAVKGATPLRVSYSCELALDCAASRHLDLEFTAPVTYAEVQRFVRPAPDRHLSLPDSGPASLHWRLPLTAAPGDTVRLTIEAGLHDVFGRAITNTKPIVVPVGDRQPAWWSTTGLLTLPRSAAPSVRVRHINIDSLRVTLYRHPRDPVRAITAPGAVFSDGSLIRGDSVRYFVGLETPLNEERTTAVPIRVPDPSWMQSMLGVRLEVTRTSRRARQTSGSGREVVAPVRWASHTLLLQFTDLMTHLRAGAAGGAVFVTDVRTGAPMAGVTVRLHGDTAPVFVEARTDARGVARLPALTWPTGMRAPGDSEEEDEVPWLPSSPLRPPVAVEVSLGADHAFTSLLGADASYYGSSSPYQRYFRAPKHARALVFPDRGIYRPGEMVFFNTVVRDGWLEAMTPAANERVRWRVLRLDQRGAQGVVLLQRDVTLSAFGTHADSVRLPALARVGEYAIRLERQRAGRWTVAGFTIVRVGEYRAPEFTVTGAFTGGTWSRGDTTRSRVTSRLLFDAPLVGARVTWRAAFSELRPWDVSIPGLGPDWQVGRATRWWEEDRDPPTIYRNGDGTTDANGMFDVAVPTDSIGFSRGAAMRLDASVTDVNGQSVSTVMSTTVSGASFYLASRVNGQAWWWRAGQAQQVRVGAITGGGMWVNGVTTHVTVLRQRWEYQDAAGNTAFRSVTDTLQRDSLSTRDSSATFTIMPTAEGMLEVVFTAVDARGREASTSVSRWVMGNGAGSWWSGDRQALPVFVNKDSVRTGDTLSLSFSSPFPRAQAWITVERAGVLSQERLTVSAGANTLSLPVRTDWIPEVSIGVLLVREGDLTTTDSMPERYRVGLARVTVDKAPRRLTVSLHPRAPEYRPGAKATVDIRLADSRGRPVEGEVVVWATDEGVLSLTGFETPNAVAALYDETFTPLTFATTLASLARGLTPLATDGRFGMRVANGSARFSEGVSLQLNSVVVSTASRMPDAAVIAAARSDFRTTAFYRAGIRTDAAGRAQVLVRLPDNLTTFRVMAIAVDATDRIGSEEGRIVATKPLLVRAAMPRFVRPADTFLAGGVVNTRGRADSLRVQVIAAGDSTLRLAGPAQLGVTVGPAGARARFNWSVGRGASARMQLGVTGGALQDAVAITLPVQPDQHSQAHTIVALVRDSATLRFTLPRDIDPARSRLTIRVGPTPLPVIRTYAAYLDVYPYLCTEQLTSAGRAIVSLLELHRVGATRLADAEQLRAKLRRVVDLVATRQRPDGAFGYWSSSSWSLPWLDAYVGTFLLDARNQGVVVPPDVIRRTVAFLDVTMAGVPLLPEARYGTRAEQRARIAQHLSQRVAAADFLTRADSATALRDDLLSVAHLLTFEDRARLTAVMARRPDRIEAARTMLTGLWTAASVVGNRVEFPDSVNATTGFQSRIRPAAWLLRATQALEPRHPLIGPLVQTIIQRERAEQGGWWNTQDYAFAAQAVASVMRGDAAARASFALRGAGGTMLIDGMAGAEVAERTVDLTALTIAAGDSVTLPVSVTTTRGAAYVTLTVQALRRERPVALDRQGLVVERWYERMSDGRTVTEVAEGDLVRVRLRITAPGDREFVAVEDPLPAGLEAVDTKLRTTSIDAFLSPDALASDQRRTAEAGGESPSTPWWYWTRWNPWDETETYDDRVVFHARTLGKGAHLVSYVARATIPGRFVRAQAHAEEMYNPALSGRSDGGWLVVTEKRP